jgi:hypothetical protein
MMNKPTVTTRLLRRWYVLIAGSLITAVWVSRLLTPDPVYWMKSEVLFVESRGVAEATFSQGTDGRLVPFASAIERQINRGQPVTRLSSRDAPLYGAGVRHGYKIELPNAGLQWVPSFPRPALTVEVVGESAEEVQRIHDELIERIRQLSDQFQKEQRYSKRDYVVVVPQEPPPDPVYVGPSDGGLIRGAAAGLLVGLASTVLVALVLDRWMAERANRKSRVGPRGSDEESPRRATASKAPRDTQDQKVDAVRL